MNLILTMAGKYQRFANEGFKTPKYLLPWGDRTILTVILSELSRGKHFDDVYLVANHRDEAYMPHVRAIMKAHGIKPSNLLMTEDTSGQVETAMIGCRAIAQSAAEMKKPLVIHNIDTILLGRDLTEVKSALQNNAGFIDVFGSNNKDYSYVLVDAQKKVFEIAEKIVVSNLATSGLYGFQSAEMFQNNAKPTDVYVSSVFKRLIEAGQSVVTGTKHKEADTIVLGTPAEYMNASLTLI